MLIKHYKYIIILFFTIMDGHIYFWEIYKTWPVVYQTIMDGQNHILKFYIHNNNTELK